jgi:hypothetical protein
MMKSDSTWVWVPLMPDRMENYLSGAIANEIDREILAKLGVNLQEHDREEVWFLTADERSWLHAHNMQIVEFDQTSHMLGMRFETPEAATLFALTWTSHT